MFTTLVLALTGVGWTPPPVPAPVREEEATAADLTALTAEFTAAEKAWIEKLRAAAPEEQQALFAQHPAPAFWERFRALADAGQTAAWEWLVENAYNAKQEVQEVCLQALTEAGGSTPVVSAACDVLENYVEVLDRQRSIEVLAQALAAVPDDASRARCATTMGILMCGSPDEARRAEGLELLRSIAAEYDGEAVGQRASDEVFRAEHLCPGAVAPAIVGSSIDGEPRSLADHRGKIVVLDFFGFW